MNARSASRPRPSGSTSASSATTVYSRSSARRRAPRGLGQRGGRVQRGVRLRAPRCRRRRCASARSGGRSRRPTGATATGQTLPESRRSAVLPANSRSAGAVAVRADHDQPGADLLGEVVQPVRRRRRGDDPVLDRRRRDRPGRGPGRGSARPARCRSATHSASTRAGLIAAGAGCTTATISRAPEHAAVRPAPAPARRRPTEPPSNPTTTGAGSADDARLTRRTPHALTAVGRGRRTRRGRGAAASCGSRTAT